MNANLKLISVMGMLNAQTPMEVIRVNARVVSWVMELYAMVNKMRCLVSKGKVIGCVVVSTKITISRDLGT